MGVRRVSPAEAKQLMDDEGYIYVDVRSVPEFEAGHPQGAYNVPLLHLGPAGMTPNPDFQRVVESSFARDAKLIVACQMGGRSARAAALLDGAGYANVVDQSAGFEGTPYPPHPGWRPAGLPVEAGSPAGRSYESLRDAR